MAGPESQDTDFTWAEFVRRNNDELVSTWGNLVNRTASMIAKNFGAIPAAGQLTAADHELLAASKEAFGTVGDHLRHQRLKLAIGAAMHNATEANQYLSQQAPWKESDPERKATILHVAAQVVADSNRLLAPFLPHSAQRVHEALGGTGTFLPTAGDPRGRRPRRRPAVPDHHRRLLRAAPLGVRSPSYQEHRSARRRRSSRSCRRKWSTRSSPDSGDAFLQARKAVVAVRSGEKRS